MVIVCFISVLQDKQGRRSRDDDSPIESAIARARRRAGTLPPGADADGQELILPHPIARLFAWLSGFGILALAGIIAHWWWHSPGRGFSAGGIALFSCGMIYGLLALNMAVTRASMDQESFALNTLFRSWRVQRADVVGCHWLAQFPAGSGQWYVEQVLVDRAGRCYRIPNILKDRIPHGSWIRKLGDHGNEWPPSWPLQG